MNGGILDGVSKTIQTVVGFPTDKLPCFRHLRQKGLSAMCGCQTGSKKWNKRLARKYVKLVYKEFLREFEARYPARAVQKKRETAKNKRPRGPKLCDYSVWELPMGELEAMEARDAEEAMKAVEAMKAAAVEARDTVEAMLQQVESARDEVEAMKAEARDEVEAMKAEARDEVEAMKAAERILREKESGNVQQNGGKDIGKDVEWNTDEGDKDVEWNPDEGDKDVEWTTDDDDFDDKQTQTPVVKCGNRASQTPVVKCRNKASQTPVVKCENKLSENGLLDFQCFYKNKRVHFWGIKLRRKTKGEDRHDFENMDLLQGERTKIDVKDGGKDVERDTDDKQGAGGFENKSTNICKWWIRGMKCWDKEEKGCGDAHTLPSMYECANCGERHRYFECNKPCKEGMKCKARTGCRPLPPKRSKEWTTAQKLFYINNGRVYCPLRHTFDVDLGEDMRAPIECALDAAEEMLRKDEERKRKDKKRKRREAFEREKEEQQRLEAEVEKDSSDASMTKWEKEEKRFKRSTTKSWRTQKKEREWKTSLLQADNFDQKYHRKAIKSGRKHG